LRERLTGVALLQIALRQLPANRQLFARAEVRAGEQSGIELCSFPFVPRGKQLVRKRKLCRQVIRVLYGKLAVKRNGIVSLAALGHQARRRLYHRSLALMFCGGAAKDSPAL